MAGYGLLAGGHTIEKKLRENEPSKAVQVDNEHSDERVDEQTDGRMGTQGTRLWRKDICLVIRWTESQVTKEAQT